MADPIHDEKFTVDKDGNRVRRGLTVEETSWYEEQIRQRFLPERERKPHDFGDGERFLQLDQKHHAACMQVLGAENVLRVDKPSRH